MTKPGAFTRFLTASFLGTALHVTVACGENASPPSPGQDWIALGGNVDPIQGHQDFCQRSPADCSFRSYDAALPALNDANRRFLADVQEGVNARIHQRTDREIFGQQEYWTLPTSGQGDCEDIALEKRRELIERGWPASALMIAAVRQRNGDGHAVLIARTAAGDYVLDNLRPHVVRWDQTDYTYLKVTDPQNHAQWLAVVTQRGMNMTASTAPRP